MLFFKRFFVLDYVNTIIKLNAVKLFQIYIIKCTCMKDI